MWNSTFKDKPRKPLKRSAFKKKPYTLKRSSLRKHAKQAPIARITKVKPWSTHTADTHFSRFIRGRDPICRLCKVAPTSDCSHFWGRGHSGTRFDPKNCIGICRPCHDSYEHKKNNEYKDWMVEWLGTGEYEALEKRARSFKKRSEAVLECREFLSLLQ